VRTFGLLVGHGWIDLTDSAIVKQVHLTTMKATTLMETQMAEGRRSSDPEEGLKVNLESCAVHESMRSHITLRTCAYIVIGDRGHFNRMAKDALALLRRIQNNLQDAPPSEMSLARDLFKGMRPLEEKRVMDGGTKAKYAPEEEYKAYQTLHHFFMGEGRSGMVKIECIH